LTLLRHARFELSNAHACARRVKVAPLPDRLEQGDPDNVVDELDGTDEGSAYQGQEEEEAVWAGRPSLKVVWLRLAVVLMTILCIEIVLLVVYGFSAHWSRLLVYMAYALAVPLFVGSTLVRQMREHYEVTTQCIYTRVGLLTRTDDQLDLRNYLDCRRSEPSLAARMLRLGNIEVFAENDEPVLMRDIDDSEMVFKLIKDTGYHARGHVVRDGARGKLTSKPLHKKGAEEERSKLHR